MTLMRYNKTSKLLVGKDGRIGKEERKNMRVDDNDTSEKKSAAYRLCFSVTKC